MNWSGRMNCDSSQSVFFSLIVGTFLHNSRMENSNEIPYVSSSLLFAVRYRSSDKEKHRTHSCLLFFHLDVFTFYHQFLDAQFAFDVARTRTTFNPCNAWRSPGIQLEYNGESISAVCFLAYFAFPFGVIKCHVLSVVLTFWFRYVSRAFAMSAKILQRRMRRDNLTTAEIPNRIWSERRQFEMWNIKIVIRPTAAAHHWRSTIFWLQIEFIIIFILKSNLACCLIWLTDFLPFDMFPCCESVWHHFLPRCAVHRPKTFIEVEIKFVSLLLFASLSVLP